MSYCSFIQNNISEQSDYLLNKHYHDNQYGFSIEDDDELFGRFILEINQAGLSWTLMLRKQESFRVAYDQFSIEKIAAYTESDRERLLLDPGIIRNRLKINAAIVNAQKILDLKKEFGTFKNWLDFNRSLSKVEWIKLFKKTFKFTGGEIVNEFLMSTGYLPGAHTEDCPVYKTIFGDKT
ncbi:DNA-3-methyladenine glycosylase I [Dyadobacter psychrotolerans]|uniref:DNA-3-methyladenine glycosylase I n=1 Tax=Dyadobacter psychrotolerans TaxID=2541721 RepID=A0A4R5D921_9BACT|nr:DNA-3-methyladenine glycosylase I [Dyadobacter psychrotolerans]TDE10026.1 DNA-3-methyladenine glycosylase I [Dyadobacter psychrotolerans]